MLLGARTATMGGKLDIVPVEYLESAGGQKWIDTGVVARRTVEMEVDLMVISGDSEAGALFGVYRRNALYELSSVSDSTGIHALLRYGKLTEDEVDATSTQAIGDTRVKLKVSGSAFYVDGVKVADLPTEPEMAGSYNLLVFASRGVNAGAHMRLYGLKIYDNGTLVRDFIPVRVGSGNKFEGAMYDCVTRKLFKNKGTGEFLYGNDKPWGLCFTALEAGSTVSMQKVGSAPSVSLETSVDGGSTWSPFTVGTTTITLANTGDKVYFRASKGGNTRIGQSAGVYNRFVMTGSVGASGCVDSLLDANVPFAAPVITNYCYYNMFYGCTSLASAPELPATALANFCYYGMFYGCTSLASAPELPATALANYCYYNMFYGCTSLASAPELPATALANSCYYDMFYGCTSLASAPELPATALKDYCYYGMFYRCTSLTSAPELPATALSVRCYNNMFYGCTSLASAPELPATALANSCYGNMFSGCTSLTSAPELPATALKEYCYSSMFYGCTSLASAPELPATALKEYCYYNMFQKCTSLKEIKCSFESWVPSDGIKNWVKGVAATGTFYCPAALGTNGTIERGVDRCPTGWTVVNI